MSEFTSIKSTSVPLDSSNLITEIKKYEYALLIKTDSVSLIAASDCFDMTGLVEVRAFKKESELHAVLVNGAWRGRIRTDGEDAGTDTEVFDCKQLIWGKSILSDGKTSELYEDRGIRIKVPIDVPVGKRACLSIRSYLSDNEFEFIDYRICAIEVTEVNDNE